MREYLPYSNNTCPSCLTAVQFIGTQISSQNLDNGRGKAHKSRFASETRAVEIFPAQCPNCDNIVISAGTYDSEGTVTYYLLWPRSGGRPPAPPEVPLNIAADFGEACLVLHLSPKSSAALSRRCLQAVLSDPDAGNTQKHNLSQQIEDVIKTLPAYIGESVDAIREIGNFAAHEQKSTNSGAILDVEEDEAEWNLDTLELLFDHYYVRPAAERKRLAAMNKKLADAGRKPLKQP